MNGVNNEEKFNLIIKSINAEYEGKSLDEVIELMINSDNLESVKKLLLLVEKSSDDILDLSDDIKAFEEEYQKKLNEVLSEKEEADRRRIDYNIKYNTYKRALYDDLDNMEENNVNRRIIEIDNELNSIEEKENLLEGNISRRLKNRKEELIKEKEELSAKIVNLKDLKEEAEYLQKEEEKTIKALQSKRNDIATEKIQKEIEFKKEQERLQSVFDMYIDLYKKIENTLFARNKENNIKFYEIEAKLMKAVTDGNLQQIIEYSSQLSDVSSKKIELEGKVTRLLQIFGRNPVDMLAEIKYDDIEVSKEEIQELIKKYDVTKDSNENKDVQTEEQSEPVDDNLIDDVNNQELEEEPAMEEQDSIEQAQDSMDKSNNLSEEDKINDVKNNNYEDDLIETDEATKKVSLDDKVDESIFNEEQQLINIHDNEPEPSLEEKMEINNQKKDELNKLIEVSNNEEEKMCYRKIILSINMTNYKIINNKITDKNPIIRTSRGEYISADLLGEYNSAIDELTIIEQEQEMIPNQENNSINNEATIDNEELESINEDVEENLAKEESDSTYVDDEFDNYGFENSNENLPTIEESSNEIVNNTSPFVLSEDLNNVMTEAEEEKTESDEDDKEDEGLEFLPSIQPAKIEDDFIDETIDNVTAPSDLTDDEDDYYEDDELSEENEENKITSISQDGKIIEGNFLVQEEPQENLETEQNIQPEPVVESETTVEPSNVEEKDESDISNNDFSEENSHAKVKTKTQGKNLLARIREKKEEGLTHPGLRGLIDEVFDEEAQGVYNNMLDEQDRKKEAEKAGRNI